MNKDFKLILIIVATFLLVFFTSLLLEIPLFQHWLRQGLVILFMLVQFYIGYLIVKDLVS